MIQVPQGFFFATHAAGFKYTGRDDVAVLGSTQEAAAAGVFTQNAFQAAPVRVARERLQQQPTARAIVVNAGQANACTGQLGMDNCYQSLALVAEALDLDPATVLPASTGVIGDQMPMALWPGAAQGLKRSCARVGPLDAAKAMVTTDSFPKLVWRAVDIAGREVRFLGLAKGAGMICPNMATMLGFVLCDGAIDPAQWQTMLSQAVERSFNRITVDGDTSTNDCVLGLANGASGVPLSGDTPAAQEALDAVCRELAYFIVQDAEGGTKVARIRVRGAADARDAEQAARTIAHSPLVKTALFGRDPNWGRIVAALGRSGAAVVPEKTSVAMGGLPLFENGVPVDVDLDSLLAPYLDRREVPVDVDLGIGQG
ncbi:MAG: bifunctional glutamate N-acetyltransferase/amino-acid acetyltransferase ArgJ, partial [Thermodesulfobacteriota bacterium]